MAPQAHAIFNRRESEGHGGFQSSFFFLYDLGVLCGKFSVMQNSFVDLADALRERLAVIADETSRRDREEHIARLKEISQRIDNVAAGLPKPIDPQLAHFLQRKSYDKALALLEGRGD